jgi:hypothetical protein
MAGDGMRKHSAQPSVSLLAAGRMNFTAPKNPPSLPPSVRASCNCLPMPDPLIFLAGIAAYVLVEVVRMIPSDRKKNQPKQKRKT